MKKQGFSLMEMMIILLIVSVAAAASAPIMSKRIQGTSSGSGGESSTSGCNWNVITDGGIYRNANAVNNNDNTVIIGTAAPPAAALYIVSGALSIPHISLGFNSGNVINLFASSSSNAISFSSSTAALRANSAALGYEAIAATSSTALGYGAKATGSGSTAIGISSNASGSGSVALGSSASARDAGAIAIGDSSNANTSNTIAIGYKAMANDSSRYPLCSIALGTSSNASGYGSIALGSSARASGEYAIAGGNCASASGNNSIAFGNYAAAGAENSISIGSYSQNRSYSGTGNRNSIAIGGRSTPAAESAIEIGTISNTSNVGSVAIGFNAKTGNGSVAIGNTTNASENSGVKIGGGWSANGPYYGPIAFTSGTALGESNESAGMVFPSGVAEFGSTLSPETCYSNVGPHGISIDYLYHTYAGIHISGSLTAPNKRSLSDGRLKDITCEFTGGLAELKKLKIYNYVFKNDSKKTPCVGVIAQDLKKIFPDAISKDAYGYYTIRTEDILYSIVNAVKELDKKIAILIDRDKQLSDLENYVASLEQRASALEQKLSE